MQTRFIQRQCKDEHNSCYLHHQEGLESVFIQLESSTRTILVSDKQSARLDEDTVKTEQPVEETMSQSEPQVQNTDVGPSHQDEASAVISIAEHQQPEPSSVRENQQDIENKPTDQENLYRQTCLKRDRGRDGFKEKSKNLEVFLLNFKRTKEKLT